MKAWPALLLAVLAGCTVGPDYHRPDAPDVGRVQGNAAGLEAGPAARRHRSAASGGRCSATRSSNGLIAAGRRLQPDARGRRGAVPPGARCARHRARGALSDAGRERHRGTQPLARQHARRHDRRRAPSPATAAGSRRSWELDLWGRVRRASKPPRRGARRAPPTSARRGSRSQAQLAHDYFELRVARRAGAAPRRHRRRATSSRSS